MLSVSEALKSIVREVSPLEPTFVPLSDSLGLLLAEDVMSDVDSPPFDKALMDGYAVRTADVSQADARLTVIEEITAGRVPTRPVAVGEASRIMTGAPLPAGADAVIRLEETQFDATTNTVCITTKQTTVGANVMYRGTSLKKGDCLLTAGRRLRPQELGALAELGKHRLMVRRRPRVAVLATGDELVPVDQTPGPGQIRNSNETMLVAQLRRAGAEPVPLGIARDEPNDLRERIEAGLECDILLLSGGVSAGQLDLVPSQLQAAGVQKIFHKVKLKPGKPIWFGLHKTAKNAATGAQNSGCIVFGLPGNPVSSMVCFELFTRTAIRRLIGEENSEPPLIRASLTAEHKMRGDRPTFHPSRLDWDESGPLVCPVRWQGSADLSAMVSANAMISFPAGERTFSVGETVDVIAWDA